MAAINLLLHSVLMVLAPLVTFLFVSNGAIDGALASAFPGPVTDHTRAVAGGLLAVLAVNVVIISFLVFAWRESPPVAKGKKEN